MDETDDARTPVTYETSGRIPGPFFHGTKTLVARGTELVAGFGSNFQEGQVALVSLVHHGMQAQQQTVMKQ